MVKKGDTFNIGEICPESGVYRIQGSCKVGGETCDVSKEQYTIPLVKGKRFPPCKSCSGRDIKWEFVETA